MEVLILCLPIVVLALTNISQSKRIDDTSSQVHELCNRLRDVSREAAKAHSRIDDLARRHDAMSPSPDDHWGTK